MPCFAAVIAADVTFAVPYALLILQWYGRLIPMELDPPEHGRYRTPLAPVFSPRAAVAMTDVRSVVRPSSAAAGAVSVARA